MGDTFVSIEKLEGSQFADTLNGGNANDTCRGLRATTCCAARNGNDTIDGGDG